MLLKILEQKKSLSYSEMMKEKLYISYSGMNGQVVHVGEKYITSNLFNSNALLVIYKRDLDKVTLLQVAQPP